MEAESEVAIFNLAQELRADLLKYHKAGAGNADEQARACSALEAFDRQIAPLVSDSSRRERLSSELVAYYDDVIMPLTAITAPISSDPVEMHATMKHMNMTSNVLNHFMALKVAVDG